MAKPGPKPKPSNVHLLHGNRSKLTAQQLQQKDAVLPDVSIPKPPRHLLPEAKKEWERITPELEKLGLISELDMAALAAYCQSYARWSKAEAHLKKLGDTGLIDTTPSGYKQMSTWLQISNRSAEQMHKFMGEFGLTPSTRTRVTPSPQPDLFEGDDADGKKSYF
jgi:P27 family predicted phage terminase small subunit